MTGQESGAFPGEMKTTESAGFAEQMQRTMPGGDTRTSVFYTPFPLTMKKGSGCRLEDVDGNEYIDLLNNFTSLIHGHAHPEITTSLADQASLGTVFGAPTEAQLKLSALIRDRIDSIDLLRFTNSGSEAVLMAVRAARAYTDRSSIVKLEGGYHGSWEQVQMTLNGGPGPGVPEEVMSLASSVQLNDIQGLRDAVEGANGDLAAIILEPVMGEGVLVADTAFLQEARRLADSSGALLIFDEVISFRLGFGGYQGIAGIRPDLTTLGKVIGGGMPVGAFGGSSEVMSGFDPRNGMLEHAGTYNGNVMTMVAGEKALELLTPDALDRIGELGERLTLGLDRLLRESAIDGRATGTGSLTHVHFDTGGELPGRFEDLHLESETLEQFHRVALAEGLFIATRGIMCTSTAMDESDVDEALERFARAIRRLEGDSG